MGERGKRMLPELVIGWILWPHHVSVSCRYGCTSHLVQQLTAVEQSKTQGSQD